MDIASRLVFLAGPSTVRVVASLVVAAIALTVALAGAAMVADLLRPASETLTVAPFRWS